MIVPSSVLQFGNRDGVAHVVPNQTRFNSVRIATTSLLAIAIASAGCGGPNHGDRTAISGKVTKKGDPLLEKATIYFEPDDGVSTGTMGEVKDGAFTIPKEAGPTPGKKYKVLVTTYPGIPAEGTPVKDIKQPQKLKGTIDVPTKGATNLDIEVE